MADKYIYNNSGVLTERSGLTASAGAGDAGKIVATDVNGLLAQSFMPVGIGPDTASITASEALAAGDFVNIHNSSGAKVRKADASTAGKEAHGFVLASVISSGTALVYFEGPNISVSGATPGLVYLSDSVAGGFTSTAPTGTGKTVQRVGVATSATAINFEGHLPVVLA